MLKTIQMTLDRDLLEQVDELVGELDTTRSAFIRELLERELRTRHWRELERLDEEGYRLFPPDDEEVEIWLGVQDWGDGWNVEK
jgi:metal-responsive CopG/Arc/MetJ family transcriptional regulator